MFHNRTAVHNPSAAIARQLPQCARRNASTWAMQRTTQFEFRHALSLIWSKKVLGAAPAGLRNG
jgi:hypothetical protein